jgi:hypothetical protein
MNTGCRVSDSRRQQQPGLRRNALRFTIFRRQHLEVAAVRRQEQHLRVGRARDDLPVVHHRARHRLDGHGLGERRRQLMQARRARRQRAMLRFTGTERAFGALPLGQLLVRAPAKFFGVKPGALHDSYWRVRSRACEPRALTISSKARSSS